MVIERILFNVDIFINMLLKLEKFFFVHAANYIQQQQNAVTNDGACSETTILSLQLNK